MRDDMLPAGGPARAVADAETMFAWAGCGAIAGLAALQVLWSHAYPMLGVPMPAWQKPLAMFPGVTIFFVVSGYLVSSSLERQADLRHYFKNRLLRIYPGLWVCVTVALIAAVLFGFHFHALKDMVWYPAQLLGFIYTPPALSHFGVGSYDSALWTIPIELQFYVVLPLVYWLIRKTGSTARGHLVTFLLFTALTIGLYHFLPGTSPRGSFGGNGNAAHSHLAGLLVHTFVPTFYLFLFGVVLQRMKVFQSNLGFNGLDTIKRRTTIPVKNKAPTFRTFYEQTITRGLNFDKNGTNEKHRQLLVE